jgi:TonB family protein
MRFVSKMAAFLLAAAGTAALAQESAPPDAVPGATPNLPSVNPNLDTAETLKMWDQAMELLRQGLWRAQSEPTAQIKDSRGRTMADDLNDHILTATVSAELERLREEARAKEADEAAVRDVLTRVEPVMKGQAARIAVITMYWGAWMTVNHHHKLLEPLLAKASEPDRAAIRAHVAGMEKTLLEELNATLAQPLADPPGLMMRFRGPMTEATRFYNERRLALVQQQADPGAVRGLKTRTRQSACPPPVAATEARDKPGLAPGNSPLEEVYPAVAKGMSVEGPVVLRVRISETGCMQEAVLVMSSGAEDLDDAALLWAENARYIPASKDGKGVEGSFPFRVKFELQ